MSPMLQDQLRADLTSALKNREAEKLATLRLLVSALSYEKIAKQHELSDEEVVAVLKRESKKRLEAIALYEKGNRPELADQEKKELTLIKNYLPDEMDEEKIREIVTSVLNALSPEEKQNFGKVMQKAMAELKGQADGAVVSRVVKELLGN